MNTGQQVGDVRWIDDQIAALKVDILYHEYMLKQEREKIVALEEAKQAHDRKV